MGETPVEWVPTEEDLKKFCQDLLGDKLIVHLSLKD